LLIQICVKDMTSFFQKKLILWDVDYTLINWNSPAVLWRFRHDWNIKSKSTQMVGAYRGTRRSFRHNAIQHDVSFSEDSWEQRTIKYLQQKGHFIGIYSDFPQTSLSTWFETMGIYFVSVGCDSGTLKPLPDGCLQLMAQFDVIGSQTYLIGDGLRTDARAISQVGGHFIPIEDIRAKSLQVLDDWIS